VTEDNYRLVETPVEQPTGEDQVLLRALYVSVDPYMRIQQSQSNSWEAPHPLDTVQGGYAVAQVLVSNVRPPPPVTRCVACL
jgi:NADPH-dependent curcumin reductase CurA